MLLALQTPQLIMMLLCFAGMLGFASVAGWLWIRQRRSTTNTPPRPRSTPAPEPSRPAARESSSPAPAAAPTPTASHEEEGEGEREEEEPVEPTEFVALPGRRDPDSPQAEPELSPSADETERVPRIAEPSMETAIVSAAFEDEEPVERTEFIAPALLAARHAAPKPAPEPESEPERTEFVAPHFDPPTAIVPRPEAAPPPALVSPPARPSPAAPKISAPIPPASAPTRPAAPRPSSPTVDLAEHLSLAATAMATLEQTPSPDAESTLAGHLEVLASAPAATLLALVRTELEREVDPRWSTALLALLHSKTWAARTELAPLVASLDEPRQRAALRVLRSWPSERAPALAAAALDHAPEHLDQRLLWLECLATAGWDPGTDAIEAALAHADPRMVALGLRLLARTGDVAKLRLELGGHLFAPDPGRRMAAIEAALTIADNSAWLVCRQLARNPSFPVAAQLVGLLGTPAELAELRRAFETTPSAALLAGLALSGRRAGLEPCLAHFETEPSAAAGAGLGEAARAGLTLASGQTFESSAAARAWLDEAQDPDQRLLGGRPCTPAAFVDALAEAEAPARRALARELGVRSRARLHLDPDLSALAWRRTLAELRRALERAPLDFDRGFPWADDASHSA